MTIKELITHYYNSSQLRSFSSSIGDLTRHKLSGVVGSFLSLLLLHNRKLLNRNQIIILESEKKAKALYSDLENLSSEDILFFPSSSKSVYKFKEIENANVLFRTEVLNKIKRNKGGGIIINARYSNSKK